ncbi:MAG TPA: hypothetical protein VF614_05260 [Chthoniobacteraceae bacterium]|jgi:hypothetical protein
MNEQKAKEILGGMIGEDGSLKATGEFISWEPGESSVTLDGHFTVEELEAIAWWMRNQNG